MQCCAVLLACMVEQQAGAKSRHVEYWKRGAQGSVCSFTCNATAAANLATYDVRYKPQLLNAELTVGPPIGASVFIVQVLQRLHKGCVHTIHFIAEARVCARKLLELDRLAHHLYQHAHPNQAHRW